MRFFICCSLLFTFACYSKAQNVLIFNQTVNAYWNTAGNWTCPGGATCPPLTVLPMDSVKINGFCTINPVLTITNHGVVQVNAGATLSMEEIGWFNNHGTLNVLNGATSNNDDGGVYRLHAGSTFNLDGGMGIFDDFGGDLLILPGSTMNIGPTGTLTYN